MIQALDVVGLPGLKSLSNGPTHILTHQPVITPGVCPYDIYADGPDHLCNSNQEKELERESPLVLMRIRLTK